MRNIPIVTKNLLIVNVVAFLACMLMDKSMGGGSGLTDMFGLHFFLASDFHIYQLVTYMFMHGGFQHIGKRMAHFIRTAFFLFFSFINSFKARKP